MDACFLRLRCGSQSQSVCVLKGQDAAELQHLIAGAFGVPARRVVALESATGTVVPVASAARNPSAYQGSSLTVLLDKGPCWSRGAGPRTR